MTALYLNSIFESPSHHKYDGLVYHHVDRILGPDPEGDRVVHARGMRIIVGGVFNHINCASPFFTDVVRHQPTARFADRFSVEAWDDPEPGTAFAYRGGWGAELPE